MKTLLSMAIILCGFLTAINSAFAQTWTQTSAPTNQEWNAIASSADGCALIAVGQTGVYFSTNSGNTWTPAQVPSTFSDNNWRAAAASADGVVFAAGDYGHIYISTNSGLTWLLSSNAPEDFWYSIACSSDGKQLIAAPYYDIAAGNIQPLYISTDFGFTWTATLTPTNHLTGVASSKDGTTLFALVSNGPIYISTNSGVSWTTNNTIGFWNSIACSADGRKAVAVANPGQVYTTTNSGVTWVSHLVFGAGTGFGSVASSADGAKLLAVGYEASALIFVSTNSGNSWVKQTNAPSIAAWNAVASSADGHKMFAATYGFVVNDDAGGVYILQSYPSPRLSLTLGTNFALSWLIPSTNFVLQQSADLISWSSITDMPTLNLTNLNNEISLSPTNNNDFFRLISQ
jgi:photosystem II stability/assembly factor-like uncharacterized protein